MVLFPYSPNILLIPNKGEIMKFTNDVACTHENAPQRSSWHNVIMQVKRQRGGDYTVSSEWLLSSNYIDFYDDNFFEGSSLSCSAMMERHFSKETCVFIPAEISNLFRTSKGSSGLSVGVSIDKKAKDKIFQANVSINGKLVKLGRFKTEKEAANAYSKSKREVVLSRINDCLEIYKKEPKAIKSLMRLKEFYK